MKNIKYLLFVFLCFININIVYASDISKAYDYTYEEFNVDLKSKNVILYNLTDNYKLVDIKSDEKVQIASLTKIMTTIVSIENIKDLDEKIILNSDVFKDIREYTKAGFKNGDKVSYRDLLYGAMLPSGADAVNALMFNVTSSKEEFIKLMNDKAKELKMVNTNFDNGIGMDSKDNYSTAYDLAILLNYAINNSEFKKIFTAKEYRVEGTSLNLKSTLSLYGSNLDVSSISGSKSGFTDGAGVCLASIATINDVDYLLIVLGANSNNKSNAVRDTVNVYEYLDKNYGYKVLLDKDKVIKSIDIVWGKKKKYDIKASEEVKKYVKNTLDLDKLKYKYDGINELKYSIKKGTKLGTIDIIYGDKVIGNASVYLNEDIKYYHPLLYAVMLLSFLMMIISLIFIRKNKRRKSKKKRNKIR